MIWALFEDLNQWDDASENVEDGKKMYWNPSKELKEGDVKLSNIKVTEFVDWPAARRWERGESPR